MKSNSLLTFVLLAFILISCQNSDNAVISYENNLDAATLSTKPIIIPTEEGFSLLQSIDGNAGGTIKFDTSYFDINGDSIAFNINIRFLPKSFSGVKEIQIVPHQNLGSIEFFPDMNFNNFVLLNLSYKGLNLSQLGFDSNSKIDFVYQAENGTIENILSKQCNILWNQKQIFVTGAQLSHFSRYAFVRKCQ